MTRHKPNTPRFISAPMLLAVSLLVLGGWARQPVGRMMETTALLRLLRLLRLKARQLELFQ